MRGDNEQQAGMYSYISPEQRVPADHPLRPIRKMTDEIFKQLSPRFDKLYSRVGRPSIGGTQKWGQACDLCDSESFVDHKRRPPSRSGF